MELEKENKDPAVLWYFDNWFGGTCTLSRHLKGCYMDLLFAQFNNGHLSLDEIKTVLGSDFGSAWPTLQKKFKKDDNGLYYNRRLLFEVERRKKFSEKQSDRRKTKTKSPPDQNQSSTNKEHGNETGIEDLYLNPKDYLLSKISVPLTELNMKSLLSPEDFDFCLTQWSLKAESDGWQYSGNDEADLKRLRAGFEKWLNSWVKNNAQKLLQKKNERSTSKHDDLRELRDSSIAVVQGNNAQ